MDIYSWKGPQESLSPIGQVTLNYICTMALTSFETSVGELAL